MNPAPRLDRRMTAAEYLDWERQQQERHEFVGGEVFQQAGGTRRHSLISTNIIACLSNLLRDQDCQAHGSDMRIHVEATGMYAYPDVSVVCPPFDGEADDVISNPVLLAEVLSPSTADYDRGGKFGHYRQIATLSEFLAVSQSEPRIEQHSKTEDGLWVLRDISGQDGSLTIPSLNLTLPVSGIYDKVEFDAA